MTLRSCENPLTKLQPLLFIPFLFLPTNCGAGQAVDTSGSLEVADSDTTDCKKAKETNKDLLSLLDDLTRMKNYANGQDVGAASSFCSRKQLGYMKDIDWSLGKWTGEAYNIIDPLCDDLSAVHSASGYGLYPGKKPQAAQNALGYLNTAENNAKTKLSAAEQNVKKHCSGLF
ncbi:MAG: hypothetical protein OXC44_02870 [Proteobacteria bacterium]|nr:hypothetical protein [Pseudomonadota bacterium]